MTAAQADEPMWTNTEEPPEQPRPEDRYRPRRNLPSALRDLWHDRAMIRSLAEREMRARYKQTYLGIAWAVVTPFALMLVFVLFFKRAANVETGDAPYSLFSYLGLLPWTFFSMSISQGGVSLISNVPLLNKVYCPREVFPLASVCLATVDTGIACFALVVLFAIEGFMPHATSLYVPLLLLIQVGFTIGVALIASSVMVYLRDLRTTLPLALQLGLFATPIAYGLETIPSHLRGLYVTLNPLATVIDGYRRTVLYGEGPRWEYVGLSSLSTAALVGGGYWLFKRLEGGIADVA